MGFSYIKQKILTNMCKRSLYHFPSSGWSNPYGFENWCFFSKGSKYNSSADGLGGGL